MNIAAIVVLRTRPTTQSLPVTLPSFLALLHRLQDLVHNRRIRQRRRVSQLILLPSQDLPHNSSHDLAGPRFGQVVNNVNCLRRRERSNLFPDLHDELLPCALTRINAIFERHESIHCLSGHFVVDAYHGGLGNTVVLEEGGFDFGRGQTVA